MTLSKIWKKLDTMSEHNLPDLWKGQKRNYSSKGFIFLKVAYITVYLHANETTQ